MLSTLTRMRTKSKKSFGLEWSNAPIPQRTSTLARVPDRRYLNGGRVTGAKRPEYRNRTSRIDYILTVHPVHTSY